MRQEKRREGGMIDQLRRLPDIPEQGACMYECTFLAISVVRLLGHLNKAAIAADAAGGSISPAFVKSNPSKSSSRIYHFYICFMRNAALHI